MVTVFWLALAVVGFTYLGYPVLMAAVAALRPRPVVAGTQTPTLDVLLVVHNAAAQLPAKVANLRALDYPRERLRIHIVCDGCSDDTEAVARALAADDLRVFAFAERHGKSACIGRVLPLLHASVVLFTDVRQRVDPGAARALAAALSAPDVGAASGELVLETASGYAAGIDAYWRYEKLVRRLESASGSLVGVTGALYAARRTAISYVPPGLVLDDMWIPLAIADAGYRVVFVPEAIARDRLADDHAAEETRKRRTLMGNYQLLHQWPRLALPGGHPLVWRLWGHKWLRLLAPWLLMLALAASVVLAVRGEALYVVALALQVAGYALAWMARSVPAVARAWQPARLAAAFLGLNLSALRALPDYLRTPHAHLWQPSPPRELSR